MATHVVVAAAAAAADSSSSASPSENPRARPPFRAKSSASASCFWLAENLRDLRMEANSNQKPVCLAQLGWNCFGLSPDSKLIFSSFLPPLPSQFLPTCAREPIERKIRVPSFEYFIAN